MNVNLQKTWWHFLPSSCDFDGDDGGQGHGGGVLLVTEQLVGLPAERLQLMDDDLNHKVSISILYLPTIY